MATGVSSTAGAVFKPGKEEEAQPSAPQRDEGQMFQEAPPNYFEAVAEQPPAPDSYPPSGIGMYANPAISEQPPFPLQPAVNSFQPAINSYSSPGIGMYPNPTNSGQPPFPPQSVNSIHPAINSAGQYPVSTVSPGQPSFTTTQQFIPTPGSTGLTPSMLIQSQLQTSEDSKPLYPGPHTFRVVIIVVAIFTILTSFSINGILHNSSCCPCIEEP